MRRLLIAALALFTACTQAPARDPAVVEDVLNYIAKIKKWEPVEAEALKAINDVKRSQFVDDEYVAATLGAVMDDLQLHLAEINQYQPRTPPVNDVHQRYRQAWQDIHDAFTSVISSMERKDYMALAKGTEALRTSRQELLLVAAALDLLMEESGLKDDRPDDNRPASS